MLDMNKLRSEFEATPEIKAHLDHGNVFGKYGGFHSASELAQVIEKACENAVTKF